MDESKHVNIAILSTGKGDNTDNIIKYFQNFIDAEISCIISNKEDEHFSWISKKYKIKTYCTKWYKEIDQILTKHQIHYIILDNYLDKIPYNFIQKYNYQIINIHPSLLPNYGGKGMYGDTIHKIVKNNGDNKTGISVHFVDQDYNTGKVFFQKDVKIYPEDKWEDIKFKVQQLEKVYYPVIIEKLIRGTYDHLFKSI